MNEKDGRTQLLNSFLLFTRTFYKARTGREFLLSQPTARESHYVTISKALTRTVYEDVLRLIINCPPRYGKTELLIHYVAWCLAHFPDANFLYISYSHTLAKRQTQTIREIVSLPFYKKLFGVEITPDSRAKDDFKTIQGGSVYAAGAGGTVTGYGAGIQGCARFGGAIVIDDIHKPIEVTSDIQRQSVLDWFKNTLQSRLNDPKTPIIFIGQRLHEDDLGANLLEGFDGHDWEHVLLPALDQLGHALNPRQHTEKALEKMAEKMPYEFAAQYQQNPSPAGGGIFKRQWFIKLEFEPDIYYTFITADTAETAKTVNDATVFSFWGLYKIEEMGMITEMVGLHWIDCQEIWIEPKDLKDAFIGFYKDCMRHKVQPDVIAIEKKSTGVTLTSVLSDMRGLNILPLERTVASGSKTQRFLAVQPFIAGKRLSIGRHAKHTDFVLDHMGKITANNSHRRDDIADTAADALQLTYIDKTVGTAYTRKKTRSQTKFEQDFSSQMDKRLNRWQT